MNIKDYEYIVAIAEYGSITKAAERLCITQSALTRFLQRLEQQLDIPLFNRMGNQFLLTSFGKIYVDKGKEIIRLDRMLSDELGTMRSSGQFATRFACSAVLKAFMMEVVFPEFYEKNPFASVCMEENSSSEIIRMLEENKVDIGLGYGGEFHPRLRYISVGEVKRALAVPVNSPLLKKAEKVEGLDYPVLRDDSWLDEPYIMVGSHTYSGNTAQKYFNSLKKAPHVRMYVMSTRDALTAVENGLGNSIMTTLPYTDKTVRYVYLPDLPQETRGLHIILRKNDYLTEKQESFVKIIQKCFAEY